LGAMRVCPCAHLIISFSDYFTYPKATLPGNQ
jgi:hypothetical protein